MFASEGENLGAGQNPPDCCDREDWWTIEGVAGEKGHSSSCREGSLAYTHWGSGGGEGINSSSQEAN